MKTDVAFVRSLPNLLALALLAAPGTAQGTVHVVDAAGGPGAQHTTLASALAAAGDGDVLLVRAGTYPERLDLGSRSLTVTAEPRVLVQVLGFDIQGLRADQQLFVRGLVTNDSSAPAVRAQGNLGPIWFEDCRFRGLDLPGNVSGGLAVVDGANLVLARCTVERAVVASGLAPATLSGTRARLVLHGTTVVGPPATGAAVELLDSELELSGASVRGGDGFDGIALFCTGQDGGTGLRADAPSRVIQRDSVVAGGEGGLGFGTCADGLDGAPVVAPAGVLTTLATEARSLEIGSPVRAGAALEVRLAGNAADLVWILYAPRASLGSSPGWLDGALLLAGLPQVVFFGALDGGGSGLGSYLAPALPPGVESSVFVSQAILRAAGSGTFHASSPTLVTLLDATF